MAFKSYLTVNKNKCDELDEVNDGAILSRIRSESLGQNAAAAAAYQVLLRYLVLRLSWRP